MAHVHYKHIDVHMVHFNEIKVALVYELTTFNPGVIPILG